MLRRIIRAAIIGWCFIQGGFFRTAVIRISLFEIATDQHIAAGRLQQ